MNEPLAPNSCPAFVPTIGGFRPTKNPLTSHFGLAPLALADENWPVNAGHNPLFFVCQFNLTELPSVPDVLQGISLITFYLDNEARVYGRENGQGWLVRAYPSLESLVPLSVPVGATFPRGFEVRWEQVQDLPNTNVYRTKIGGYASYIQSEPWWTPFQELPHTDWQIHPARPEFCFQLTSEEKLEKMKLSLPGFMYFARGTEPGYTDQWFLDGQWD